jgi:hypothetical protein
VVIGVSFGATVLAKRRGAFSEFETDGPDRVALAAGEALPFWRADAPINTALAVTPHTLKSQKFLFRIESHLLQARF